MAARIRAIIERIKQEPGWLLVLLGLLTLYVTYKLYQRYAGGGQNTGGYVPSNGIDVPLYPSSVGGTPGNPGGSPTTAPGGLATDYGQQLQDLLNALGGNGVVPSIPTFTSGGTASTPSTTTSTPVTSGGKVAPVGNTIASALSSAASKAATAVKASKPKPTGAAPTHQPSTVSSPPVGNVLGSALSTAHYTVPGAASSSAQQRHQNQQFGY